MKLFFLIITFLFFFFVSEAQVSPEDDDICPKDLISFSVSEVFLGIGKFQINYEHIFKKNNSLEIGFALKPSLYGNNIPVIRWGGFFDPTPLEYLSCKSFSINSNYKINIPGMEFRTYLSLAPYYRSNWYDNKFLDLSTDGTSVHSFLYWQSVKHDISGLNIILGRQIFFESGIFIDLYIGAGARINNNHTTLFKEYSGGNGFRIYDPPLKYSYSKVQPTFQFGMKIGMYTKRRK
jgi:hypothetical protein